MSIRGLKTLGCGSFESVTFAPAGLALRLYTASMTAKTLLFQIFATSLVAVAADKVRFEDLPNRLNVMDYRAFTVVTGDGKAHRGKRLRVDADHVSISQGDNTWEELPSDQVSRVEIRQTGRLFRHVVESAVTPFAAGGVACDNAGDASVLCMLSVIASATPYWAYAIVTNPVYLVMDAIGFFMPPTAYEIVQ